MAYALPADLITRYDVRTLGDLVNDTGIRQSAANLLTDANLQAALDDAAGLINAATLVGQRYTVAELTALTGVDLSLLKRINCDLAFGYLQSRRGNDLSKYPNYVGALELLDSLRQGEMLFNVAANVAAGTPQDGFPSLTSLSQLNLLTNAASKFFPVPRVQTPQGN